MTNILTYGTFDLIHYGHIILLQRAKSLGAKLFVGVSTDEFNLLKNKKAYFDYQTRVNMLKELKCVDVIFPENNWEQKIDDIKKYNIDIFTMGSDWEGKFDDLNEFCKVHYLQRTSGVSSTMLRKAK